MPVFRNFGMFQLCSDGIIFGNTFNYSFCSIGLSLYVGRAVGYIQCRQDGGEAGTNYGGPEGARGQLCCIYFYISR